MKVSGLDSEKVWDYENGYYWFSSPTRLNKTLAHYELYKSITDLPGHIFELGVYKGASLIRFATFRASLENDHARKIVGFDAFGEFPTTGLDETEDQAYVSRFEQAGGHGLQKEELQAVFAAKQMTNIELVKGNVFDTLPSYLAEHPETRLALLHLDMDVKEPTEFALDKLYERVVPDGLIVFDDYNAVAGETIAVDNFVRRHHLKLEKLPFYNVPAFVRKPR